MQDTQNTSLFASFFDNGEESESLRRKIWTYLAIGIFSLILHGLGRFFFVEMALPVLLLTIASSLAFALVLYILLDKTALPNLRNGLGGWQFFIILFLGLIGFWLGSRGQTDLLYLHAGILYLPFALLLYSQLFHEKSLNMPLVWLIIFLLLGLVLLIRLLGLSYYPVYQRIDEPWVFSFLVQFERTGNLADGMYYGRNLALPLGFIPMALWRTVTDANFWSMRFFQVLLFLAITSFIAITAYHLYGKRTAVFTGLAAFASVTLYGAVHIRHDIIFMLMISASLAAYAYAIKRESSLWHGIAGALIGLSVFAHFNAVTIGLLSTLTLYLPYYLERWQGKSKFSYHHGLMFIMSGVIAAIIAYHINYPPNSGSLYAGWSGILDPIGLALGYFYYQFATRLYLYEQILIFAGFATLFYRLTLQDKTVLAYFLLAPLLLPMFVGLGVGHYVFHIALIIPFLIGRGLDKFLDFFPNQSFGNASILGLLILAPLMGSSSPIFAIEEQLPIQHEEPLVSQWIKENIPEGSVVVGTNWYYFFLYEDYVFYSNRSWRDTAAEAKEDFATMDDFWDAVNPDVVIIIPNDKVTSDTLFDDGVLDFVPLISPEYLRSRGYEELVIADETIVFSDGTIPVSLFYRPQALLNPIEEN